MRSALDAVTEVPEGQAPWNVFHSSLRAVFSKAHTDWLSRRENITFIPNTESDDD